MMGRICCCGGMTGHAIVAWIVVYKGSVVRFAIHSDIYRMFIYFI